MKIRKIIRNLLPYGIVADYKQKHLSKETFAQKFWNMYLDYLVKGDYCSLIERCPVRTVVSVQGFGHSGSGAVVDLLREYSNVVVVGGVDDVGSCTSHTEAMYEVDFLRSAGGLFEIERYIGTRNIRLQDALLHRFVLLVAKSELFQNVESTRKYFFEFLRNICTFYDSFPYQVGNPHLDYKGINYSLFLNQMSVAEYRLLCRKLLNSIFTCYHVCANDFLVLDQFVGDREYELDRYLDYVPNLKPIVIYRDLRDVYVFAKEHNICWIPNSSVEYFIDYYKRQTCSINLAKLHGYYVTSFERLIRENKTVVSEIEDFLSLDNANHIHPLENFNPAVSVRGVGIWKKHPELDEDCDKIKKALGYMIYYKD